MFCKVFFFYSSETPYEKILKKINEYNESFQIITNRTGLEEFLHNQGKNVSMVDVVIPSIGNIGLEVDKRSKKNFELYENELKDFKCKDIPVFSGFDYKILATSVLHAKLKMILEEKINTVFIFEVFNPLYFILLKNANELGFQCEDYIQLIKKDKIEKIKNDDQRITSGKNEFSINQSKNYLRLSLVGKPSREKINTVSNYSKKIISLGIKKTIQKYSSTNENELQDKILKEVHNKIKKLNLKKLDCLFFVTAAREDLYLTPWFPIFEKFDDEKNDYLVITSDIATSLTLSKQNIPYVSIFEEVKLLEEKIPSMKIGQEFREFLESKNREDVYWSEFSELFSDTLKKAYRTIALILIINNIFDKEKIKSIIACACGEILENTAISVSKKFNVPSFSMLTVSISPPYPWFSNWFKTDKIFVHGLNGKNDLTNLGYKNEKIIISGNPKFDKFLNMKVSDAKKSLEIQYQIDSKKKLIVIAMSKWHSNDEVWIPQLIKYCNENNIEIIIKVHPKYQSASNEIGRAKIMKIEKECKGLKYLISYDMDLSILLSATDLVITEGSFVGMEAVLFGKELIIINFPNDKDYESLFHLLLPKNTAVFIESFDELIKTISDLFFEHKINTKFLELKEKIVKDHNYYNDNMSSNRIFDILVKKIT